MTAPRKRPPPRADTAAGRTAETLVQGRSTIAGNAAMLRALELYVTQLHQRGDMLAAAAWAQIAGDFASRNHPGRFSSPPIEAVLADVGRRLEPRMPTHQSLPASAGGVKRVLHVLTEAYDVGGHTRLARRWIERDSSRQHSVVLTRQRIPVSDAVRDAAEASGGSFVQLEESQRLAQRVAAVRRLAADVDMVVLHHHMQDVVPALAFADRDGRPPVLCADHADHLFWLGTEAVDALAELRVASCRVAEERRGFDPQDIALVPIPLELPAGPLERAQARAALGVPRNAQVLLSVSGGFKYAPVLDTTFQDLVGTILRARPRAILLAAGPSSDQPGWKGIVRRFPQQVRTLGPVTGIETLYAAADVYADSYPCISGTSAPEAALHGMPVVTFAPDVEAYGSMLEHAPGLEPAVLRESTPEAWCATVLSLLDDPSLRREHGEQARQSVRDVHLSERWNVAVESAYERALTARVQPRRRQPVRDPDVPLDWESAFTMVAHSIAGRVGLDASIAANAHQLVEHQRPTTAEELMTMTRWTGTARMTPDADEVYDVMSELRAFNEAGALKPPIIITAAADALDSVAALIEQNLADGGDLDITLVPSDKEPTSLLSSGVRPLVVRRRVDAV